MREVNFSIPNVNKASVGITTALYDRRALDCTSTLPLINSLNHLAYLTTSSARIRDILTIDGGVERLVCILKEGRSPEMMEMWKWNLAFQCIVNIGVRGSETVRTRVVEADMVPVIATILHNYIRVVDQCREKVEAETASRRKTLSAPHIRPSSPPGRARSTNALRQTFQHRDAVGIEARPSRRQEPPPAIEIPSTTLPARALERSVSERTPEEASIIDATPTPPPPQLSITSPIEQPILSRNPHSHHRHHHSHHHHHHHHHHHRSQDGRLRTQSTTGLGSMQMAIQSTAAIGSSMEAGEGAVIRPIRDVERLPSSVPSLHSGFTSQPESPTTPSVPPTIQATLQAAQPHGRRPLHHASHSGDSDDANVDEAASETSATNENVDEPMVDIESTVDIQQAEDQETMLTDVAVAETDRNVSEAQEATTFHINHQSANDGSIITANAAPTSPAAGLAAPVQPIPAVTMPTHPPPQNSHARYLLDRSAPPGLLAATPRDEDVLMSLQLLAYVSKYCDLRAYFQQSHLVPKLKISDEALGCKAETREDELMDADDRDEEYLLPDDYNIFPLVEKFTVRHHSQDMQHWAGVVMRNLCRKDDGRGGIRQCAYYNCGKWEKFTRQFAKCRRCRRTKYCSKECQKLAWTYHRHWCQVATP